METVYNDASAERKLDQRKTSLQDKHWFRGIIIASSTRDESEKYNKHFL